MEIQLVGSSQRGTRHLGLSFRFSQAAIDRVLYLYWSSIVQTSLGGVRRVAFVFVGVLTFFSPFLVFLFFSPSPTHSIVGGVL